MNSYQLELQYYEKVNKLLTFLETHQDEIRESKLEEQEQNLKERQKLISLFVELTALASKIGRYSELQRLQNIAMPLDGVQVYAATAPDDCSDYKGFVVLLSHELGRSGAPVVLLDAAKILKAQGYYVVVISPMDGALRKEVTAAGIPVVIDFHLQRGRLESEQLRSVHSHQQWPADAFVRYADMVIANTAVLHNVVERYQAYGKPMLWWLHEGSASFSSFGYCMPKTLPTNIRVLYVCEYVREQMQAACGFSYEGDVLQYGLADFAQTVMQKADASRNHEKIRFVMVGAVDSRKGQDILLQAIQKLPQQYLEKAYFYFVGGVVERSMYEKLSMMAKGCDYMSVMESIPRDELLQLYTSCDCIVCPSRDDPLPVVLTEMMILSKPSICSNHTGSVSFLTDGENSFIFESQDVDALAQRIMKAIDEAEKLPEMGRKSRYIYEQSFTLKKFEQNFLHYINEVEKGTFHDMHVQAILDEKQEDDEKLAEAYNERLKNLYAQIDKRIDYQADFERRARRLSVKKEIERIESLDIIQEKEIRLRQLQDSYDLVIHSKWWKLTAPIRKVYEKLQSMRHQKTMTEQLQEIADNNRYQRIDYATQRDNIWFSSAREFADGEKSVHTVLTSPEDYPYQTDKVTVSVVIPSYNAGVSFRETLTALKGQQGIGKIEIIVVDSGSTDETVQISKENGVKVIEIPHEEFSHSHARNVGADAANGQFILFMTQDAAPTDERWLCRMLSVLCDDVVAVSPMEIDDGRGDLKYNADSAYHAKYLQLDKGDHYTSFDETMDANTQRQNAQLTDVSNLIRKDIFMKYRYEGDYAEDLRLGLKLIKDGYRLAQLSSVCVYHAHNRKAEYCQARSYVDRKALCDIFPALLTEAMEPEQLRRALEEGKTQLAVMLEQMRGATADMDNIVVYGRNLEHCIQNVLATGASPIMQGVMNYVRYVLMPYVTDKNGAISPVLHEQIIDAIEKAYYSEAGCQIANCELKYGEKIAGDAESIEV